MRGSSFYGMSLAGGKIIRLSKWGTRVKLLRGMGCLLWGNGSVVLGGITARSMFMFVLNVKAVKFAGLLYLISLLMHSVFHDHLLPNSEMCVDAGTENTHFKNLTSVTKLHEITGPIHVDKLNRTRNTQTVESSHSVVKLGFVLDVEWPDTIYKLFLI